MTSSRHSSVEGGWRIVLAEPVLGEVTQPFACTWQPGPLRLLPPTLLYRTGEEGQSRGWSGALGPAFRCPCSHLHPLYPNSTQQRRQGPWPQQFPSLLGWGQGGISSDVGSGPVLCKYRPVTIKEKLTFISISLTHEIGNNPSLLPSYPSSTLFYEEWLSVCLEAPPNDLCTIYSALEGFIIGCSKISY